MLRVIIETLDGRMARQFADAAIKETVKSFDIYAPELEAHLKEGAKKAACTEFFIRQVAGIEIIEDAATTATDAAEPKRCRDCKYHLQTLTSHTCQHSKCANNINGDGRNCWFMREQTAPCGPDAKLFEPGEPQS